VVWREDEESVESEARIEWVVGGTCFSNCGGVCGVQYWVGDAGIDFIAFDTMRLYGTAADFWIGAADWSDGAFVEHG
jgi:hypothetical protein